MQIVGLPRGAGKTTAVIQWMMDAPDDEVRIGVFRSHQFAMQVLRAHRGATYKSAGEPAPLLSWQFVSIDEVVDSGSSLWSALPDRHKVVLGLDDLDDWISSLLQFPVGMITVTSDRREG